MGYIRIVAFWVGFFKGFRGNDFVAEYEAFERKWYDEIIREFLA